MNFNTLKFHNRKGSGCFTKLWKKSLNLNNRILVSGIGPSWLSCIELWYDNEIFLIISSAIMINFLMLIDFNVIHDWENKCCKNTWTSVSVMPFFVVVFFFKKAKLHPVFLLFVLLGFFLAFLEMETFVIYTCLVIL